LVDQEVVEARPADERIEASKIIQKLSRKDNGISMGCGVVGIARTAANPLSGAETDEDFPGVCPLA
jgi:hypothetical protein